MEGKDRSLEDDEGMSGGDVCLPAPKPKVLRAQCWPRCGEALPNDIASREGLRWSESRDHACCFPLGSSATTNDIKFREKERTDPDTVVLPHICSRN